MRTRADLEGAFGLLEREADTFAAQSPSHSASAEKRPRIPRRVTALVAAVTVVALVGVTVGYLTSRGGPRTVPSGGGVQLDPRTVSFSLDPAAGLRVLSVSSDRTTQPGQSAQEMDLRDRRHHHARIDVMPPNTDIGDQVDKLRGVEPGEPVPGLTNVTINGRPGYYGEFADTSNATPGSKDFPPKALVFAYAPRAWAWVGTEGAQNTQAELTEIATAIDFGGSTPVRTPFALRGAPKGMQLTSLAVSYTKSWDVMADYSPTNDDQHRVIIEAAPLSDPRSLTAGGAVAITVNGHPAYWSKTRHEVRIDAGSGVYVFVKEAAPGAHPRYTMARAQLVSIAASVRLASSPEAKRTWFDAEKALP